MTALLLTASRNRASLRIMNDLADNPRIAPLAIELVLDADEAAHLARLLRDHSDKRPVTDTPGWFLTRRLITRLRGAVALANSYHREGEVING